MTATGPNNHHLLRKWLRLEPHQPIGAEGEAPYLLRWYVIPRNRWLNIYLHKFLRDDDDRALHDHPWWFVSLMLWGQYKCAELHLMQHSARSEDHSTVLVGRRDCLLVDRADTALTCGLESNASSPTTVDEQQRPGTSPTRVIDAAHLARQRAFSLATFGPGARTNGVLDHIGKELNEIRDAPDDISEWVDVIILAFDGAWRAGWEPQQIIDAILAKQTRNEQRTWPDWRTADPNKAIEHVHSDVDGDVNR
ncbi:Protein of uncharacterised function (DUF550) [Mycobacteroides abscessus subsp. abscessus]|uniref:dATP/dGTP pyrophosphohydrolase domain-containing protein n=1 Tax=Mycobacteroides abscessus TaxID=36809 RepID=UPI00092699D5|nr:dATP/dGTP pyrophosphohydrolase domain-containing protein [Mycobacteroides abscessus]SID67872.1 Protein of uncharacterised function (DUF550) [Mycobacteroides abscessus subsp. abscessus]SKQ79656.1 Protein of uncharacterised function (DUF550) [Mycobacteroides abscessus subsp. abscessus]